MEMQGKDSAEVSENTAEPSWLRDIFMSLLKNRAAPTVRLYALGTS